MRRFIQQGIPLTSGAELDKLSHIPHQPISIIRFIL